METNGDINFLLSILHCVTITESSADRVIKRWPVELCAAPIDSEELGRRIKKIRQKWIGDGPGPVSIPTPVSTPGLASTPIFTFAPTPVFGFTPSTVKKESRKFRVPPAANLITPRSVEQSKVRAAILDDSVIVVDLCESSDETTYVVAKKDAALTSSIEKRFLTDDQATPVVNKDSKSIKATKPGSTVKSARSKAKKKLVDDSKPKYVPETSPTLSPTRKRRSAVDYNHVPEDEIFDRSDADDDDFQCEEVDNNDDDERLGKEYEKRYPVLETPSKRQKRAKR